MRQTAATFILGHFAYLAGADFWHNLLNLKIRKFFIKKLSATSNECLRDHLRFNHSSVNELMGLSVTCQKCE